MHPLPVPKIRHELTQNFFEDQQDIHQTQSCQQPLPIEGEVQEPAIYPVLMQPPKDVSNEQPPMVEVSPTPQVVGTVMQTPMIQGSQIPGQVIMIQQPSSSSKVIGILLMILSGFSLIGIPLGLLPQADPMTGETIELPFMVILVNSISGLVAAIGFGLGGYWMTSYQRRGVQLALITIAVGFCFTLLSTVLGGDGGLGSFVGDGAAFAIIAGFGAVCNGACALIVAIPLMVSNSGLDDSSLFK